MAIPKEVLAVERPTNTVVIAYGKNKDLYAVRQRIGCKNVNGRHTKRKRGRPRKVTV